MRRLLAATAVALLTLSGCASGDDDQAPATVTETVTSSSTTTSETSSTEETSTSASAAAAAEDECLVGSMGQPQFSGTTCLDKTVASCGDPGLHETGTTFFTDGTSGWTQTCANQMMAAPREPVNQVVVCPDGSTAESHYDCPVESAPEQDYQPPAPEQPAPVDPGAGGPDLPADAGQGTGGY